jgi:phytoene synthase
VVYAWCRRADDAVDELPQAQARLALERLERELGEVYAGVQQSDPLLDGFATVVKRFGIPQQYPRELLLGMRMDVEQAVYRTLSDLYLYCYRVAGTVGLMMCHVMGVRHPKALKHAVHLGIGMQLTNICRDVCEDWQRQRLYLPRELLDQGRLPSLARGSFPMGLSDTFAHAMRRLLSEADRFYASGDAGLAFLSFRCRWAVFVARLVYSRIGSLLLARGCDATLGRAYVPLKTKLKLALGGLVQLLFGAHSQKPGRHETPPRLMPLRYPADVLPL